MAICVLNIPTLCDFFFLLSKEKYMTNCPSTYVYGYQMTTCGRTCQSLSQSEPTCRVQFTPLDGCGCANGTYLNDKGVCVPASHCPCYVGETVVAPRHIINVHGQTWWGFFCFAFIFILTFWLFNVFISHLILQRVLSGRWSNVRSWTADIIYYHCLKTSGLTSSVYF